MQLSHGLLHGVVWGQTHSRVYQPLHQLQSDTVRLSKGDTHLGRRELTASAVFLLKAKSNTPCDLTRIVAALMCLCAVAKPLSCMLLQLKQLVKTRQTVSEANLVEPARLLELLFESGQLWQLYIQAAAQVQKCLKLGGVGHLVRKCHLGSLMEVLHVLQ